MVSRSRTPVPSAGRTCTTCPAFLEARRQNEILGSSLGAPVCGVKNLPLVMPKQGPDTGKKVLAHVAKNCDKYGIEVKIESVPIDKGPEFLVGFDLDAQGGPTPDGAASLANCQTCTNYVDSVTVNRETGWTGSICKARGLLMPDSRLRAYAKDCNHFTRQVGPRSTRDKLGTFNFFPQYQADFGQADVTGDYKNRLKNFVDPSRWENERPWPEDQKLADRLKATMEARGIRAWRRIADPEGYGEDVYLPVYDPDAKVKRRNPAGEIEIVPFLTDREKALVPRSGDKEHPELYADHGQLLYSMAVLWMKLDETPAWWGQGGTGKTEFARHLAWLMQLPFNRISINGSKEVDELAGKMLFEQNETVFVYGELSGPWIRPGVILLDEPNTGQPEVWQLIRPLTDNSRTLVLSQNKNEALARHDECYFTMAMNPAWDPRNIGTQTLGDADGSRLMHMFFSLPPEPLEIEIIQQRVRLDGWEVPTDKMKALMKVAKDLREQSDNDTFQSTWGLRHQIKTARALRWFSPVTAYRRAVGDYLPPEQLELLMTAVKSQFGE